MKTAPAIVALLLALVLDGAGIYAWGQSPPPQTGPGYADVAPIFQQRCITCHSGRRPPKGLRLDTYENIRSKDVIVPGSPQKSELFLRVIGTDKPRMPRNGPPWLTEEQTALIEQWIASGARQ